MPRRDLTALVRQTRLPEAAWEKPLGRLPHEAKVKARFSQGRCQAENGVTSHDTLREVSEPLFDIGQLLPPCRHTFVSQGVNVPMRFNDYHVACHPYQVPITLPLSPRSQARSVAAAAEGGVSATCTFVICGWSSRVGYWSRQWICTT